MKCGSSCKACEDKYFDEEGWLVWHEKPILEKGKAAGRE